MREKAARVVLPCGTCGKVIEDYASNRTRQKHGTIFCSVACRGVGVGLILSRHGVAKTKAERDAEYYVSRIDRLRASAKKRYWEKRDVILASRKAQDRALKLEVIAALGGGCACCGERTFEFLTVDHIRNNGAEHRRQVGIGRHMYRAIKEEGFPKEEYRILCLNCNTSRGFYGYCPHNPDDRSPTSNHAAHRPGRPRTQNGLVIRRLSQGKMI